ncbi:MAG: glycosyltransferase family 4 protein [Sphaerospermopsis sp. SIO1G2]|nr:glycosyltransferase family 4 protein [Sphaerospermopsis sp. SIO1G1]NET72291.1 glycosyltransferase family 4 protein [Sphaerospermopsis sp. SIO1G2]
MKPIFLAIICDYLEEEWHSMNLCSQMLFKHLQTEHPKSIEAIQVLPQFKQRFQNIPKLGKKHVAFNADRFLNRFWYYPQYLKPKVKEFDFYHIADHSYAHLALVLPPEKTGVYCHDIDAFRSLIEPEQEPRPAWYQAMSRRILRGLQSCSLVFYSNQEIRKQIEHYQLVEPSRLVHAPLGVASEFSLIKYDHIDQTINHKINKKPFILHVGSCIPRKRIDVLLDVFAKIKNIHPELQLVKVSGEWTQNQKQQIQDLEISQSIIHLQGLERTTIASLYQQASAVLLTSEAEGFGLPIIEALACGAIVIASDLTVLREVGGKGVIYCPVNDILTWVETLTKVLSNPNFAPDQNLRLQQAQKYSWSNHAQIIAQSYLKLASKR